MKMMQSFNIAAGKLGWGAAAAGSTTTTATAAAGGLPQPPGGPAPVSNVEYENNGRKKRMTSKQCHAAAASRISQLEDSVSHLKGTVDLMQEQLLSLSCLVEDVRQSKRARTPSVETNPFEQPLEEVDLDINPFEENQFYFPPQQESEQESEQYYKDPFYPEGILNGLDFIDCNINPEHSDDEFNPSAIF